MRIGTICRADQRGIGYQSREFHRNMGGSALVVSVPWSGWPESFDEFDWTRDQLVVWDAADKTLPEREVREWLADLDVVFAVENVYDWRIIGWAHEAGAKVVIQGNPEFYLHSTDGWRDRPHPDQWWWPTTWLVREWGLGIAGGRWNRVMPVPVPSDSPGVIAGPADSDVLEVVFSIGHSAHRDRAGALLVQDAVRHFRKGVRLHVYGQDPDLPVPMCTSGLPMDCEVVEHAGGFDDRWEIYRGKHLFLHPRRYGGLSLPVIEAAASGLAVIATGNESNREAWPFIVRLPARPGSRIVCQAGEVTHDQVDPEIMSIAVNSLRPADALVVGSYARAWADRNTWDELRPGYLVALEEVCG